MSINAEESLIWAGICYDFVRLRAKHVIKSINARMLLVNTLKVLIDSLMRLTLKKNFTQIIVLNTRFPKMICYVPE